MPADPRSDQGFVPAFLAIAEAEPNRIFARFDGTPITFGTLARRSASLAATLAARALGPGTRAAVMLRNSPAALATLFALARAGLVWVPINVQQTGDGLRYIIGHSEPALIIAEPDLLPIITASGAPIDGIPVLTHLDPLLDAATPFTEPPPGPDSLFAISYTSGTTGPPKGVQVTHRMLRLAGEAVALVSAVQDNEVLFAWEPLYHIGGSQLIVVPLLRRVVLAMVPRFSARSFWADAAREGATHIHYLGGILQILLKQPASDLDRTHGVRIAWGGGCPPDVWTAFQDRFGVEIRECYGMTEASSITTINDSGTVGAVGRPVPWFQVDLLDPSGTPVPSGERGEIVVATTLPGAITPGYFRNPDATAKALRQGRLHTGDLGSWRPGGNLVFHGRMSDSVRCRGENVSVWEVEHVAAQHPAIEDCAMIGVAADIGEQDIKLFVKPGIGQAITPADLSSYLSTRLAPYQNPRYIAVVAEFERTPSQRIMKHKLSPARDGVWDRLAQHRS